METTDTNKCILFAFLLVFSFSFNTSLYSQTVYPEFWDGKIFFKISEKSDLHLPDFEGGVSDITQYPKLSRLINEYKIQRIFRPFVKLKTPVFDQTYQIEFVQANNIETLIRELKKFDWIEYAEKVPLERTGLIPNDPYITNNTQWHITKVQCYEAWDLSTGSANVVVAVVDDAVKLTHEDLAANIWINTDEIAGNGIDDDGNGYIDDVYGWDAANNDNNPNPPSDATNNYFSHGTHCSGIAGAVTNNGTGGGAISHNVKVMACKGARDSDASLTGIWGAFSYAMNNYPDVISCSWGGSGYSQTYQNLVNEARNNRGIVVIAAAGNDDTNSLFYPAGYNNVISVASSAQSDAKSSFSNYGSWIDITAPGSQIRSTVAGSNSSYQYYSGTSMACPNVASLVGLMLSYNPSLSPADVESCLYAGADNINAQNPNYIGLLGAGRINAFNSLQCVSPTGCLIPSGLNATNITSSSATIGWNMMPNSVSYTIRYRIVGTANWITVNNYTAISLNLSGLSPCSQYEYQIRSNCESDQSNFSNVRTFNTPPNGLLNYCTAKGNNVNYEWISQVTLNTISNSSGANAGYGDFRCISTALTQGNSYTATLVPGFAGTIYTEYWRIWIDLNQNGQFDDPTERVYSSTSATTNTVNATINIPLTALTGPTTMRVVMKWVASSDTALPGACGNFAYGEVEDYAVNITSSTPQPSCDIATGLGITGLTNNQAVLYWSAVTGAGNYNLRWRETGTSTWQNLTLNTTTYSLSGLTGCTQYEFQVQTTCTNGISSNYSNSFSFTTAGCTVPCNIPGSVFTTSVTQSSAILNWSAVSGAISYNVQYRYVSSPIWQTETTTATNFSITGLTPCLPYEWQVQAVCNENSQSAFSAIQNFTTPCSNSCDPPTGIQAVNITTSSAKIVWNAAAFATAYEVRLRVVGTTTWLTATIYDLDADLTGASACTQYQFQIRTLCVGGLTSAWSNSLYLTISGCSGYCQVAGQTTANEWIQTVQIGTINNNSGNNNGYGNFTSQIFEAYQDSLFNFILTPGFGQQINAQYWRIWIDWNKDFDFEDAGELVYDSGTTFTTPVPDNLYVPQDAQLGSTRMRIAMKRVSASLPTLPFSCLSYTYGEFEDYTINVYEKITPPPPPPPPAPAIVVKLRVLLEGCYDPVEDEMTNILKQVVILANSQPFFREPWNYNGEEAVINQGFIPLNTTDWVLVEAYDPINLVTPIAQKAAFLRTDGRIYDYDGITEGVRFTEIEENGSYFFAVKPRSHLGVFTSVPLVVPNADWYDFTISASQALGDNQQKQLPNGLFVLYGGDLDHNGIINYADYDLYFTDYPMFGEYINTDINKDTRVDIEDFQILQPNLRIIGINNIRY
ncbi:MAG: S8 family serine peptidase [Sphingobacteriales bacterium]|nr:MAG: S8 family serine peptidase [Sphingobacteriales bacterium]